jgi:hypothetical protein
MTARLLRIIAAAAVLGLAALAAPALAAPFLARGPKACYVTVDPSSAAREDISLRASGFTPLAPVDLFYGNRRVTSFDADKTGVVKAVEDAPYRSHGERLLTITLVEKGNPANSIAVSTRVTALAVRLKPKRAATSSRIRFRGRGFTQSRPIWGHYVLRGRVRKTVRFADHPSSACGTFSVRRRQIPISRPPTGRWTLQVDQQKRWSPRPDSVFYPVPIMVARIIGA